MPKLVAAALRLVLLGCVLNAHAQTTTFYDEQGELKRGSRSVASHGPDVAGDSIDLYTGGLKLSRTDIDIPGNNALPVRWAQRINLSQYMGRWEPEIPRIQGIYAYGNTVTPVGWVTGYTTEPQKSQRCTLFGPPPTAYSKTGTGSVDPDEFWSGHRLYAPGQVDELMLTRDARKHAQT